MKLFSEKNLHTFFDAGIILKLIDSIGEVILGILFLFVTTDAMNRIASTVFGDEITEQPLRSIWHFVLQSFAQISNNSQDFLAFIFISHGIIKLILIAGLAKDKLWVYPLAAIAFTGFGIYQIYQLTFSPSIILAILTILDAIFIALIIHEYRYQKRHPRTAPQPLH
jgi:uncharacterized membrane protein